MYKFIHLYIRSLRYYSTVTDVLPKIKSDNVFRQCEVCYFCDWCFSHRRAITLFVCFKTRACCCVTTRRFVCASVYYCVVKILCGFLP